MKRLSHSAISKYQQCPRSYDLHYNKKLRGKTTSGALIFGSALDTAVTHLLHNRDLDQAKNVLTDAWARNKVGNKVVDLEWNEDIVYAASDFDEELLTNTQRTYLIEEAAKRNLGINLVQSYYDSIQERKKSIGWEKLTSEERQWYNGANWQCLAIKGMLMLDAYWDKVLPSVYRTISTQERIELKNDQGDIVIGFIDLIAEWKGQGVVVFDNKTSSIEYAHDSVVKSAQLALYVHAVAEKYKTQKAGYIVMRKGIIKNREKICSECAYKAEKGARAKTCTDERSGKRCGGAWIETIAPEVDINIIIDTIPERTENLVLENYADITHLIKQDIFPRNLNSCKMPWGDCVYMKYCWEGKEDGLEVIEDEGRK